MLGALVLVTLAPPRVIPLPPSSSQHSIKHADLSCDVTWMEVHKTLVGKELT
jgi:hypothetical protein